MPTFQKGVPITTAPPAGGTIEVTVTPTTLIPSGVHHFQLVVEDDSGNLSDPVVATVTVKDTIKPTAIITAPTSVQPGQTFVLDGTKSSDVAPGVVAKWIWTMVD
jgi:hypothetical protein